VCFKPIEMHRCCLPITTCYDENVCCFAGDTGLSNCRNAYSNDGDANIANFFAPIGSFDNFDDMSLPNSSLDPNGRKVMLQINEVDRLTPNSLFEDLSCNITAFFVCCSCEKNLFSTIFIL